jgi:hypothetical protein
MTDYEKERIAAIFASPFVGAEIKYAFGNYRTDLIALEKANAALSQQLDAANLKLKQQPENARLFGFTKRPSVIVLLASPRELHVFNDENAAEVFSKANEDRVAWRMDINASTPFTWHCAGSES